MRLKAPASSELPEKDRPLHHLHRHHFGTVQPNILHHHRQTRPGLDPDAYADGRLSSVVEETHVTQKRIPLQTKPVVLGEIKQRLLWCADQKGFFHHGHRRRSPPWAAVD